MQASDIQIQIQKEMQSFLDKTFPGILPEWFLDGFEKCVMEMPQIDVPYRGDTIQDILSKKVNELSQFEVGLVTNILLAVPPKLLSSNINKYLVKKIALEGIRTNWNKMNDVETERLRKKASSFAEGSRARIIH